MDFYHISFNGSLPLTWKPQLPAGTDNCKGGVYTEPDIPRICVSPTIEQCFMAIYPNISHFYEEEDIEALTFTVYKVVNVKDVVKAKQVLDAHVTDEHWLLVDSQLTKVGKVTIGIDPGIEFKFYPFGLSDGLELFLSPMPVIKEQIWF